MQHMEMLKMKYVVASVAYSLIGIAVLLVCFIIIEKVSPQNLWREIIEKQNIALSIMAAAFMLAIAIIISSAIHG